MTPEMQTFQAIAVSPGIAIGRVRRFRNFNRTLAPELRKITQEEVASALDNFHQARNLTLHQIGELQKAIRSQLDSSNAEIFDAHILMLNDPVFPTGVEKLISEDLLAPECAVARVTERFAGALDAINDDYLRERAADIRDVASRVLANLSEDEPDAPGQEARRIVVANSLSPSETARLDRTRVLGFAVETGSATSHTAILARSMRLPAVVGLDHALLESLDANDKLILDGFSGKLIVNPDARTEETYRLKSEAAGQFFDQLQKERMLHPETTDAFMIPLAANLDNLDKLGCIKEYGATGVGLFRTEYLFLNRPSLPDEEEQFEFYKSLLIGNDDQPVVVRTLDVGGDKFNSNIYRALEANPFLGLRGIRLCLNECRAIFKTQLRALLRAGIYGNLRIMLPMVSTVDEVIDTRSLIDQIQHELAEEKKECVSKVVLGVMIETPAAAIMAEKLASLVDFFSIGTNDLVQYTMAIDRGNDKVAYLYRPSHPAILELIRQCVLAAERHGLWVSVCGQAASDPYMVPLLIGIGVHELSMDLESIGLVRRVIRSISMHEARLAAAAALGCSSASEALGISKNLLRKNLPELMEMQ